MKSWILSSGPISGRESPALATQPKVLMRLNLKLHLENVNKFTQMLAENSDKLTSTFSSLETVADTLAAADIYNSVNNLKLSLEKASVLMENLNNGQGTAGQLMTNDSLYQKSFKQSGES